MSEKVKIQRAENDLMNAVLSDWQVDGNAIGLWRLPNSTKKNLIICTEGIKKVDELVIEELGTGFAFAPFDSEKKKIFLKANIIYAFENGEATSHTTSDQFSAELNSDKITVNKVPVFYNFKSAKNEDANPSEYIKLIESSILQIESGRFEKLVPSRSRQIVLPSDFDLIEAFNRLCTLYPNAFVSLVSSAETGTWLGASPELLVSVDDKMRFRTAAVAGTQTHDLNADLRHVAWTQKEIEEQALVSRYIINCFKKIRLREFEEHGPKTWKAGNLLHLKTDFEVDMTATSFPQLGTVMLKLLHPTSAVCGMPREESLSFLQKNENFDRSFYSGYLGPVNVNNETHLFVNLRCLQWNEKVATLYAGAGVTLDSDPLKEWEETELKMKTLLNIIQPDY